MKHLIRPILYSSLIVLMATGCTTGGKRNKDILGPKIGPAVADIKIADIAGKGDELPKVSLDEVENYYRDALAISSDQKTRRDILMRLAGIEMQRSEDNLIDSETDGQFFDEAIKLYQELLTMEAENVSLEEQEALNKRIDELLYQLSKAQALDGIENPSFGNLQTLAEQYPGSNFAAEADFRRAEKAFSEARYSDAQALYEQVIGRGQQTPFYQNALYMVGWSKFKNDQYESAVETFTIILDNLFGGNASLDDLSRNEKNLADDTLRVVSLSFAYLDGPKSITELYGRLGKREYHHELFDRLGKLYLEKKRYRDSADTYRHYVTNNPLSDYSPTFSVKAISVYEQGDFPSLIVPAKEEYVMLYGINSEFWKQKPEVHDVLKSHLVVYLPELAKYHHANAQALEEKKQLTKARPLFVNAAKWYGEFIETFPANGETANLHYLMAEALESAGEFEPAYEAFTKVAFSYQDKPDVANPNGADAAFSAILLANQLATTGDEATWLARKIDNALQFADLYPGDNRAATVLVDAAEGMLTTNRQPEAINIARKVVQLNPPPERKLLTSAWLILGQSEYDLNSFEASEKAYGEALALIDNNDPQRASVVDRLAASRYKRAQQLIASGDKEQGIAMLLAVNDIAPGSEIAITAQFDAGDAYMGEQQWAKAGEVFEQFKIRYPNHPLAAKLAPKLALIYQEAEAWGKAADQLSAMANSSDPQVRQQSLLLSAQLYQKEGNVAQAIDKYRLYANTYPQPPEEALEAQFQLSELYQQTGDAAKRDFWLNKINSQPLPANASLRIKTIKAAALTSAAKKDYDRFVTIRLTPPLKNSLAKKKSAFNQSLGNYQKVIDLGVADSATEANYYIGELYAELSRSILDSTRPRGLDELALEEYDILLEEQAYPFEEKAIELHQTNFERSQSGLYDQWVQKSLKSLATMVPGRYNKVEQAVEVSDGIH